MVFNGSLSHLTQVILYHCKLQCHGCCSCRVMGLSSHVICYTVALSMSNKVSRRVQIAWLAFINSWHWREVRSSIKFRMYTVPLISEDCRCLSTNIFIFLIECGWIIVLVTQVRRRMLSEFNLLEKHPIQRDYCWVVCCARPQIACFDVRCFGWEMIWVDQCLARLKDTKETSQWTGTYEPSRIAGLTTVRFTHAMIAHHK